MGWVNGVVKKANTDREGGNPHSFVIKDDDENEYFCHLGDLRQNEEKLYGNGDETLFLKEGDRVKFEVFDQEKYPKKYLFAIHVEKIEE